ncbi:MAG: bifunctional metallophosphatase/5'-nucleotidase [Epulopiscium sp. Nele67-Bin005]|nr:MAG: bifunctional metallophosphatase/5'-nucleotidase [Epulopiscium sp. Nele67-Bin005]
MIKIYFTTDTHGFIFPINYATKQKTNSGVLACGLEFQKDGNTLIIDAGDTLQGSPFTKILWEDTTEGCVISEVFNQVGYDYVTLGNHDFNYGHNNLKRFVDNLDAKCVVANVEILTNDINIAPYQIHTTEDGTKIGIVGLVTDFVPVWEKPENLENIRIKDAFESAKTALSEIKNKCDLTICIYHGGFENDLTTGEKLSDTKENIAYKIAQQLEFDVLLTGHQHMEVVGVDLFGTFCMQLPANAKQYGYIEIENDEFRAEIRTPKSCEVKVQQNWLDLEQKVNTWLDLPLGTFDTEILPLDKLTLATDGSLLANFCNQVQLEFSGADFSCTALANDLIGFEKEVSIREIMAAYQYPNNLKVLKVTPQILKMALERCAQYFELENGSLTISKKFLQPKVEHYNYDFFMGFDYKFDIKNPVGERVICIEKDGKPLENKEYTIVMSDYRATGTGGYSFYKDCEIVEEFDTDTQKLIIDYIKKYGYIEICKDKNFSIVN